MVCAKITKCLENTSVWSARHSCSLSGAYGATPKTPVGPINPVMAGIMTLRFWALTITHRHNQMP